MTEKGYEEKILVVIGREFGSGGRAVGKLVANRLGISYYDKELLSEAAVRLGISNKIFADADEKKPSMFRSLLQGLYGVPDHFSTGAMSGEGVYQSQSHAIREICAKDSCVIVGRTADYVMRDHPGLISVFLHAPLEFRAKNILLRGDASSLTEAMEVARKSDRNRADYYNYFTGRDNWGKAANYHLSIDASLISEEKAADLIISFINHIAEVRSVAWRQERQEESPGNTEQHVS